MTTLAADFAPAQTPPDLWRCYFETADGLVLTTPERFETPEEAAGFGQLILTHPAQFELHDPDDELVPATMVAPWAGVTVEPVEPVESV